jgi:hypothetical protein
MLDLGLRLKGIRTQDSERVMGEAEIMTPQPLPSSKVLNVLRFADHPLGTIEIAEKLGVSRKVAEVRLFNLMSEGKISGRKFSSGRHGVWVWWYVLKRL